MYLTVSVPVIEPGPPSPPDSVTVEEVTDSTAQLTWSPGRDNGSPITNYLIQTRTPFTVGWQRVNTGRQSMMNFHPIAHVIQIIHPPFPLQQGGQSAEPKSLEMQGIQGLTQETCGSMLVLLHDLL